MTTSILTPTPTACELCQAPAPALVVWEGLLLCPACDALQAARAAQGACVCVDCLSYAWAHEEVA